ncbi:MAG: hypothetical protein MMC33_004660 [Icmadophila ericetorum]|nr:hypothetical protein [Icmadophila ericetorum]
MEGVGQAIPVIGPQRMDSLPTEVLLIILDNFSSVEDLLSATFAYAPFHRIFQAKKSFVQRKVLQNAIHADIALDVIKSVEASWIANETWAFSQQGPSLQSIHNLCFEYYHQRQGISIIELPTVSEAVDLMAQSYHAVEYFVAEYSSKALDRLKHYSDLSEPSKIRRAALFCPKSISITERTRLQRAFFRFDLYQKHFPVHKVCSPCKNAVLREAKMFLDSFSAWEVEEIGSVYQYLRIVLEGIFQWMEVEFVREVKQAASMSYEDFVRMVSQATGSGNDNGRYSVSFPNEQGLNPCRKSHAPLEILSVYGLQIFTRSNQPSFSVRVDSLISRGLPFLQRLLVLKGKDLRDACIAYSLDFGGPPIAVPLLQRRRSADRQADRVSKLFKGDDEIRSCNWGWHWAFSHPRTRIEPCQVKNTYLRDCGYVFWDLERLRGSKLVLRSRISDLNKDRFSAPMLTQGPREASAEEQLYGLRVFPISMENLSCNGLLFRTRMKTIFGNSLYEF